MTIASGLRQWMPVPVGWVGRMQRDPLRFLVEVRQRYGDVVRLHAGPWRFHLVAHPDHVRHVLLDHQKNFPRSWLHDRTKVTAWKSAALAAKMARTKVCGLRSMIGNQVLCTCTMTR